MATSDALSSAIFTASGSLTTAESGANIGRCRIRGIYYVASVAGTLDIHSSSATGTKRISIPIAAGTEYLLLPGEGVLVDSPYAVITNATVTGATVFYS